MPGDGSTWGAYILEGVATSLLPTLCISLTPQPGLGRAGRAQRAAHWRSALAPAAIRPRVHASCGYLTLTYPTQARAWKMVTFSLPVWSVRITCRM